MCSVAGAQRRSVRGGRRTEVPIYNTITITTITMTITITAHGGPDRLEQERHVEGIVQVALDQGRADDQLAA